VPTYQYACTESACGHRFERVQSFTDDPLTVCPQCEGRLRKVFSPVGVVFKGSGFYRTDSRAAAKAAESNGKRADSNGASTSSDKPLAATGSSTSSSSSGGGSSSNPTTSTSRAASG
jgi:putative FmdB family regulatory protein